VTLISGLEVTQDHKLVPFESLGAVSYLFSIIDLMAFHSNYGSILHHFGDKARYWPKIVILSFPLAFDTTVRAGGSPSE